MLFFYNMSRHSTRKQNITHLDDKLLNYSILIHLHLIRKFSEKRCLTKISHRCAKIKSRFLWEYQETLMLHHRNYHFPLKFLNSCVLAKSCVDFSLNRLYMICLVIFFRLLQRIKSTRNVELLFLQNFCWFIY